MNNLRIVIVEDEAVTARDLAYVLQRLEPDLTGTETLVSVAGAVAWFNEHPNACDLIFMDIRLADGLSFDIFALTAITRPVIFVTVYNDYAIRAFKHNGIEYILKPFDEQEIARSLQKFKNLVSGPKTVPDINVNLLMQQIDQLVKPFKRSFLVHFSEN